VRYEMLVFEEKLGGEIGGLNIIDSRASQLSAASQSSICVLAVAPQDPFRGLAVSLS